jgi:GT2 family glycosyltransferase
VRRAVERFEQPRAGVVGGVWDLAPGRDTAVGRAIATALSHRLATGGAAYRHPAGQESLTEVDTVPFGCYRKSLWQELGGYDERLRVNEDYVFNYKARLSGWLVLLDPGIRSTYFARENLSGLAAQYYSYGWRKAEMLKTYPRAVRWRQIVPGGFVAALAALALFGLVIRLAWLVMAGVLLIYGGVLTVAAVQLAWPRRSWRQLPAYISTIAIVQLAWGLGACGNLMTSPWRSVPHAP